MVPRSLCELILQHRLHKTSRKLTYLPISTQTTSQRSFGGGDEEEEEERERDVNQIRVKAQHFLLQQAGES